jgi:hypothetical protein
MNDSKFPLPLLHHEAPLSRRDFLARAGGGFGLLALSSLLQQAGIGAEPDKTQVANPFAPRQPHFPGKAMSVIWCFLDGGPSHIPLRSQAGAG